MKRSLEHFTENEFNRIFLKNFFSELMHKKKDVYNPSGLLDDTSRILADLFIQNFGGGNTPSMIMSNHKDIEEWLDEEIENLKI